MSGEQVMLMMGEIEQRCTIVSLDSREYLKVIAKLRQTELPEGLFMMHCWRNARRKRRRR